MDYWVILGVVVATFGVLMAVKQYRKTATKTSNTIKGGSRNSQKGGSGVTENTIENGNDNDQAG
ncbi:MAG: hypothetical protein ABJL99_17600 [Aliishimia sp.]